jgi:hypothetical protein
VDSSSVTSYRRRDKEKTELAVFFDRLLELPPVDDEEEEDEQLLPFLFVCRGLAARG